MKTVVTYQSKTGYTQKYAEWIAEELGADLYPISQVPVQKLAAYDVVIHGGSLFATGILGLKKIKNSLSDLQNKKVIVFGVGLTPVNAETVEKVQTQNFTAEELEKVRFFYFRGGFNFKALSFFDRILMGIMRRFIERKQRQGKELTADEIGMLAVFDQAVDYTDRDAITELISWARI